MKALFGAVAAIGLAALALPATAQPHGSHAMVGGYHAAGGYHSYVGGRGRYAARPTYRRYAARRYGGGAAFGRRDNRAGRLYAGGYGYGGYAPYGYGYGVDVGPSAWAYAYPDDEGYYSPFAYDEADGVAYAAPYDEGYGYAGEDDDDAYAAPYDEGYGYAAEGYDDGGSYDYAGEGPGYAPGYGASGPPQVDWSPGAPPADCGQWVWHPQVRQYEWIPAPCGPCPGG